MTREPKLGPLGASILLHSSHLLKVAYGLLFTASYLLIPNKEGTGTLF